VMEGGVLGVALIGYTYILEEMGIRFLRIGGTSAGSINALLLAGLGTPAEGKSKKTVELLANLNMYEFVDGDADVKDFVETFVQRAGAFKLGWKAFQVLDSLHEHLGLNPGEVFENWLSCVLNKEGITTTRQLDDRMKKVPSDLKERGGHKLSPKQASPYLALVAADVSTETKVEFPKMAELYWNDPDSVNPASYVRASMSIPFFFYPYTVEIKIPPGKKAK
jgi:NTE family protein